MIIVFVRSSVEKVGCIIIGYSNYKIGKEEEKATKIRIKVWLEKKVWLELY